MPLETVARYPKRKRDHVDYCEKDVYSDIIEVECVDSEDAEDYPKPKKRRSTAGSRPLPKCKIFPFMELPAEIRNIIYGYCFVDPAGVYLSSSTKKFRRTVTRVPESTYGNGYGTNHWLDDSDDLDSEDKEKKKKRPSTEIRPLVPALLAVCKQIYQEGRNILYGNSFYVGDTLVMHSFLVDIGPRAALLLKSMTLITWGQGRGVYKAYNHASFAALSAATNLEKFRMHGYRSLNADAKSVATQFYRDAFPWLEAVGVARGKADAACDVVEIMCYQFSGASYNWWDNYSAKYGSYKDMSGFRRELSKLLNKRMDMIRS